ncbi:MAG: 16S rRNA (cytidine(1402)-2'-O)-methyltransferase [Cytophagales bacterium]|nr:16S rRNA (cytidine(1402)-2'-O)-methyltransferase [Cytophagales bacterium]MDW8384617.1 16S rRNA (cytidine(1402)-2'-O)-methyltransferase [Flammeovirgaceae bacterium]
MAKIANGKLYVVPTPIGNLEDITLRALRILQEVDTILAEDTRVTSVLLKHYKIQKRLESHHAFNEHKTVEKILQRIKSGEKIALVSDAGTPAISDPGFLLVREAIHTGIEIECLPGATALIPSLVVSGFPTDKFVFEGFLPPKKGRKKRILSLTHETRTIILYESPFRLIKTLEQLAEAFGEQHLASVSRELTKIFEETRRGTLRELITYYQKNTPKGEVVIVIAGKEKTSNPD